MASSAERFSRLRVCVVAKATPFIWVHHYVKAFRAACDVVTVGSSLTRDDLENTGRARLAHLVVPHDVAHDVDSAGALVAALPPDWRPDLVVFIQSGAPPIADIHLLNRPTAYLSIDTWHDFSEFVYAGPYDFVFAAQREFAAHFASAGCGNAHWLPLACDPDVHHPMDCRKDYDIAFVGSTERALHAQRTGRLEALAREFSVFVDTALDGDAMAHAYSRARLAFNSSVAQDVNMRVFEVMAMGIPLLTNRDADVNGLLELFRDGEHCVAYDDTNLNDRARHYLLNGEARSRIAECARAEVTARHTYAHRVNAILETINAHATWEAVRERPLTRGHGNLLEYLPTIPGRVADFGMNAALSKYALRRAGAVHVTGVSISSSMTGPPPGRYDTVRPLHAMTEGGPPFDTVLSVSQQGPDRCIDNPFVRARPLLRPGGAIVAGLSLAAMRSMDAAADPAAIWRAVERAGFCVIRMEVLDRDNAAGVRAFIVARRQDRPLKEIAREIYSRNPIPGMALEDTLARMA